MNVGSPIHVRARRLHILANRSRTHLASGSGPTFRRRRDAFSDVHEVPVGSSSRAPVYRRSRHRPLQARRTARDRRRGPNNDHHGGAIAALGHLVAAGIGLARPGGLRRLGKPAHSEAAQVSRYRPPGRASPGGGWLRPAQAKGAWAGHEAGRPPGAAGPGGRPAGGGAGRRLPGTLVGRPTGAARPRRPAADGRTARPPRGTRRLPAGGALRPTAGRIGPRLGRVALPAGGALRPTAGRIGPRLGRRALDARGDVRRRAGGSDRRARRARPFGDSAHARPPASAAGL